MENISLDKSIRLWPLKTESADHSIILAGNDSFATALAFSPTDLNLLASGSVAGEIKLWDAINRVCIHVFVSISIPNFSIITAIHFCPGDNIQERPGMGGHELNSGSFTRDWRRANATVHCSL
jgi:WD40 repeat protein